MNKKRLSFYLKSILVFFALYFISIVLVPTSSNDNNSSVILGFYIYWGLVIIADTIENKKS